MKVASWNIEGRLTRFAEEGERGSPEHIVKSIKQLDSDIIVLLEASDDDVIDPEIGQQLAALGYEVHTVPYDDKGDRAYQAVGNPTMKLLSRLKVTRFQELRLGDIRTILVADVTDPDTRQQLRVLGIHIDDRSEMNRLKQVEDLLPCIAESPFPVIAMGDFNAMHGSSLQARLLRNKMVLGAIDRLPHPQTKDMLQRLSEMAVGDTLRRIECGSSLQRTDLKMRPTITPKMRGQEWLPSIRMVQIDHMYVSPEIEVSDFSVARDGGSDHRAISANLRLKTY